MIFSAYGRRFYNKNFHNMKIVISLISNNIRTLFLSISWTYERSNITNFVYEITINFIAISVDKYNNY